MYKDSYKFAVKRSPFQQIYVQLKYTEAILSEELWLFFFDNNNETLICSIRLKMLKQWRVVVEAPNNCIYWQYIYITH